MYYVYELLQRLMKEMFVHVCERDCVYTSIYLSLTPAYSRLLILHCKLYSAAIMKLLTVIKRFQSYSICIF